MTLAHELFHAIHCITSFFLTDYIKKKCVLWSGSESTYLTVNQLKQIKEALADVYAIHWLDKHNKHNVNSFYSNCINDRVAAWKRRYINAGLRWTNFDMRYYDKKYPGCINGNTSPIIMWPYSAALDLYNLPDLLKAQEVWKASIMNAKNERLTGLVDAYRILTN